MSIYKTYDIRGIYPSELNEQIAYQIGQAFVKFSKTKKFVVGRDCRLSSKNLFHALTKGIREQGADVIDIGLVSTPMFYFASSKFKYPGLMITASHNPKNWNGFKLVKKGVILPLPVEIKQIEKLAQKRFKKRKTGKLIKKDIIKYYLNHSFRFIKGKHIPYLKIVVNTCNGMAGLFLSKLTKILPCKFVLLNSKLNGNFPYGTNPLEAKNIFETKKAILETKADLGIAFDEDADRIAVFDEKGRIIQPDLITTLFANRFLKKGQKVVVDVRSSKGIGETIKEMGGRIIVERVGRSFIKKKAKEVKAIFAAETSGHYYFKDNSYNDDALITLLKLLPLLQLKISRIVESFKKYHQTRLNIKVKEKDKVIRKIKKFYRTKNGKLSQLDGITFSWSTWWFNLRKSRTEEFLRLSIESKTKKRLQKEKVNLINSIKKA